MLAKKKTRSPILRVLVYEWNVQVIEAPAGGDGGLVVRGEGGRGLVLLREDGEGLGDTCAVPGLALGGFPRPLSLWLARAPPSPPGGALWPLDIP